MYACEVEERDVEQSAYKPVTRSWTVQKKVVKGVKRNLNYVRYGVSNLNEKINRTCLLLTTTIMFMRTDSHSHNGL